MLDKKGLKKQKEDIQIPVKNRKGEDSPRMMNLCGSCNACHQMTRIHSTGISPVMDRSGGGIQNPGLQKSCATRFFHRYMGNSYMQSIGGGAQGGAAMAVKNSGPRVQRQCSCNGSSPGCTCEGEETGQLQTKLTIGAPDDIYEQEADRVAEKITRMPESILEDDEDQQYGEIGIQSMPAGYNKASVPADNIELNLSSGRPLSSSSRRFMEPRFNTDFSHVRLHTDKDAHNTASKIQARAFTYGSHIWLGKGESESNKGLLAHELTHVIQQNAIPEKD